VFKKLDKLIIKAFIGPFIATFFITLLVLLMQFFWLYIDDFVGKGLGVDVIFKFIWYQSGVLVTLALPLAVLLSSLMTFGSLGESFELVAIKSSGISLLRFMRPLFIIAVFLSGVAFLFSNYIIPVAWLKSRTLLTDIVYAKPAFDLKEGEFYDKIPKFAIKIGKKESDSLISDVIIYEQGNPLQDNFIIAKSGVMRITENKRFLEFNLKDGWRYEERGSDGGLGKSDFIRLGFREYKKQFDMSDLMFKETDESNNRNNERVYSMRQLNVAIDSISKENDTLRRKLYSQIYSSIRFLKYIDSSRRKSTVDSSQLTVNSKQSTVDSSQFTVNSKQLAASSRQPTGNKQPATGNKQQAASKRKQAAADSLQRLRDSIQKSRDRIWKNAKTFDPIIPDSASQAVYDRAMSQVQGMNSTFSANQIMLRDQERSLRKHKIEWHRKLVLSTACVILFLIGAPLGSIIRKGGLGTPLIAAIIFFMVFYFSTTMGEKFAKENTLTPFTGMWMAAFILVPIGIFLTYKAMRDSQLFNKESYHRMAKSIRRTVRRIMGKRLEPEEIS
jgi:lipopolysaccharide export system permease protein